MLEQSLSYDQLLAELDALKASTKEAQVRLEQANARLEETEYRLEEANDMLEAIRMGDVDALVVKAEDGHQLYTLKNSDQTYRIFIEQMTTGAVTLNQKGHILYSNSRFAALVGLPLQKVTGQPFFQFFSPGSLDNCLQLINEAWKEGKRGELSLYNANGEELPVLLSLQTLNLDEGLSMSVIITDLSQQKQQQQLLEEKNLALEQAQETARKLNATLEHTVKERTKALYSNQERLTRILETMAEGVIIMDTEGSVTYANPMALKIMGKSQSDLLDRSYNDSKWQNYRLDGTPLPQNEHPMYQIMITGKPVYDFEIGIQSSAGSELFYIAASAAPVYDEQGNIVAGVGTFMDVTHRRKTMQQKDEFISVASHELRTPITSLKASLQLLDKIKNNPSTVMLPKLIEQANKSLNKVSVLISGLLNATKMTEGQLFLNKKEFFLSHLLNECCHHIRMEGTYQIITEGDSSLIVNADPDKIEQVLDNLVNNAVKYAPNSKVIQIRYYKENNMVKVAVIDQGPGVAPEKLPHLFERFYRVDNGGHQYSGLGLGLYISAQIIQKHNGQIGAESEQGKGSTFWFTLPIAE